MELHLLRVLVAALGAFVAYMAMGFALFAAMPGLKVEFQKYPGVYRPEPEMMKRMPLAMLAIFVSILVLAVLYALMYRGGGSALAGVIWGVHFGMLIGVFAVCVSVIHNHVNLNIGWKLTVQSGVAYFVQWVVVGIAIGLIYQF
ncbi:MAG TPA: hypothetical protein VGM47_07910 [Gammaproteobacteria bacterium]|jgi:hypothetical protein